MRRKGIAGYARIVGSVRAALKWNPYCNGIECYCHHLASDYFHHKFGLLGILRETEVKIRDP